MSEILHRVSARVIVLDGDGRILLIQVNDPLDNKSAAWITPGGGVEDGETIAQAARRELAEETGLAVRIEELGRPVAMSRGEWVFRGEPIHSEDWYFALRTDHFELNESGWTELEREVHRGWKWWTADEVDTTSETVFPGGLADLMRSISSGQEFALPRSLPWKTF